MSKNKQIAVIFNDYGARIVVNDIEPYKGLSNVAINPNLDKVKGHSPDQWKLQDGEVVLKSEEEKQQTVALNEQSAFDPHKIQIINRPIIQRISKPIYIIKKYNKYHMVGFICLGVLISEITRAVLAVLLK